MQTIDRRVAVAGLALLTVCPPARAATPEQLSIDADEGPVPLTRYAKEQDGKRPSVLLLHGSHGFELRPRAYERYANTLSAKGIDAYLLRYLTAADAPVFDPKTSTREKREAYEATRFDFWAKRVSSVVTATLARPDSSGRVGLLGFSLGGYVAAATAARDERVAALVVLYGGMPDAMVSEVKHLPPLIELHGTADRNVPPAKGEELVKLGKAVGTEAEFVVYPGRQTARFRLFRYRSNDRRRSRPHRQILRISTRHQLNMTATLPLAMTLTSFDPGYAHFCDPPTFRA